MKLYNFLVIIFALLFSINSIHSQLGEDPLWNLSGNTVYTNYGNVDIGGEGAYLNGFQFQNIGYPILRLNSSTGYNTINFWGNYAGYHQIDTRSGPSGFFKVTYYGQGFPSFELANMGNCWLRVNEFNIGGSTSVEGDLKIGVQNYSTDYKLQVGGKIRCTELRVQTGWYDYVFEKNYQLRPLYELENYIKLNKHLPDIPTNQEVESNGIEVGDISGKLLRKIEELTLYVIDLKKENDELKERIEYIEKSK